jgi:hypothetical protein
MRRLTIAVIVVALTGGVWHVLHRFGMWPYWIVVGRVVDELGNPVEGARVRAWFCFEEGEGWATTGAKGDFLVTVGAFSWTSCNRTPIQLSIEKPGYRRNKTIHKPWSWGPKFTRVSIKLRQSDPNMQQNEDVSSWYARDVDMALLAAIKGERLEVVERLLEQGADVNTVSFMQGWTALMRASGDKRLDVMELLLKKGADINAKDRDGATALIRVSSYGSRDSGYLEVVKLLLEKGADINVKESGGKTALMWASFRGHLEVVKLLLEKGAHINVKDDKGHTALHWALDGKQGQIVELLRAVGAKE